MGVTRPLQSYVDAFSSPEGWRILDEWGINTRERLAAFFANVCHETGGFTIVRENMNYRPGRIAEVWSRSRAAKVLRAVNGKTYGTQEYRIGVANGAYGDRLGNEDDGTDDDDGFNYRGGGPLQSTGKDNYRYLERKTGIPFGSHPELIEDPGYWVLVACVTWRAHPSAGDLNVFADHGNFKACCLGINYGSGYAKATPVGWADRKRWYAAWTKALADWQCDVSPSMAAPMAPVTPMATLSVATTYRVGMPYSGTVLEAQRRLNLLGYADKRLGEDGLYGPRTRSAVQDFETENGLSVTGELSPEVFSVLMSDDAKVWPVPGEAAHGVAGLRKNGDTEIKAADNDKTAAIVLGAGSAATAAQQSGALDMLVQTGKDATLLTTAVNSLVGVVKLGLAVVVPAALAFAAFLLWRRYGARIRERIEKWSRPVGS